MSRPLSCQVRVVDSLIDCDLNSPSVSSNLSSFVSELVERGDLLLARYYIVTKWCLRSLACSYYL